MTLSSPPPTCFELRIVVPDAQKDALIDLLLDLGEHEFVEGAIDCDVEFDYDPEHFQRDYYKELAHDVPVVLYREDEAHLVSVRANVQARMSDFGLTLGDAAFSLAPIADQNWRESWKASFKPIDVNGTFVILPPWEKQEDFSQPHKIVIDPGMAFGTGQHETTRLCLEIMLDLPRPVRVLDVGTGSGILAIAARMLGATHVLGNDIDAESVHIAAENALVNGVDQVVFTETPVHELPDEKYDLILANIQYKPLLRVMPDILKKADAQTKILISGILVTEIEEFTRYLDGQGVHVISWRPMGHWTGIVCEKRNTANAG